MSAEANNSHAEGRGLPSELFWLLVGALVLLSVWSFVIPIFESPDEPHHWQYARYLHDEKRLPVYGPTFVEANSPPLYYALIAPLATPSRYPPGLVWSEPSGAGVVPFAPRMNHNAGGDFERYWPIRRARLLTVLMSLATVWFCWLAGASAGGRTVGLLCASLVAFLPEFTFRGSTISNDSLVTTMSALFLWCVVRLMMRPFTWRIGVAAALALAAAYLSKISAICLGPPLALALWSAAGSPRVRMLRVAGVVGLSVAIVAPWSLRNVVLYGDPFASGAMAHAVGHIMSSQSLTSPYFWTTFPSVLSRSFVAVFGWMNLAVPESVYWGYWALGVAGLLTVAVRVAVQRTPRNLAAVLAAIVVLNLAVVVHINRSFIQPQGRYMFVSLPALALLVALGLAALTTWSRRRLATFVVGLAAVNVAILVLYVVPAYYPPVTPSLSNARAELTPQYRIDLQLQPDGWAQISGVDPQVGFPTRLEIDRLGFMTFRIAGVCHDDHGDEVEGHVYFEREGGASQVERVPFRWRADGQEYVIRLPLLKHPGWRGVIQLLRIDPIDASLPAHQGDRVRIENVRLVGNLSVPQR